MSAIWMVSLSMLSCIGISSSDCICSERSAFSSGWVILMRPSFFWMFRWMTPPMLALKKPRAAMVRPKLLPPTKPKSFSKMPP